MDEYDWADQERLVRQDVEEIEKQMKEEQDRWERIIQSLFLQRNTEIF